LRHDRTLRAPHSSRRAGRELITVPGPAELQVKAEMVEFPARSTARGSATSTTRTTAASAPSATRGSSPRTTNPPASSSAAP
jgi:hypothetical protein